MMDGGRPRKRHAAAAEVLVPESGDSSTDDDDATDGRRTLGRPLRSWTTPLLQPKIQSVVLPLTPACCVELGPVPRTRWDGVSPAPHSVTTRGHPASAAGVASTAYGDLFGPSHAGADACLFSRRPQDGASSSGAAGGRPPFFPH